MDRVWSLRAVAIGTITWRLTTMTTILTTGPPDSPRQR
jgi:hypothetical protein